MTFYAIERYSTLEGQQSLSHTWEILISFNFLILQMSKREAEVSTVTCPGADMGPDPTFQAGTVMPNLSSSPTKRCMRQETEVLSQNLGTETVKLVVG